MSRTVAAALLLVALCTQGTGCTLIGAGIGAAAPRYESVEAPPAAAYTAEPGVVLEVVRASDHQEFLGILEVVKGDELVLVTGTLSGRAPRDQLIARKPERVVIKVADIEALRIRVRNGTHWVTGAVVGAVLDAVVIAFVVTARAITPGTFPAK